MDLKDTTLEDRQRRMRSDDRKNQAIFWGILGAILVGALFLSSFDDSASSEDARYEFDDRDLTQAALDHGEYLNEKYSATETAAAMVRYGDIDCNAFTYQSDAQAYLFPGDPYLLDQDGDGVACELLP